MPIEYNVTIRQPYRNSTDEGARMNRQYNTVYANDMGNMPVNLASFMFV